MIPVLILLGYGAAMTALLAFLVWLEKRLER